MKKLLAFLLLGGFLFGISTFGKFDLLGNDKITKVCVVSSGQVEVADTTIVVASGNQYYYTSSPKEIKQQFDIDKVTGVILYFNQASVEEIADYYNINYYRGGDVEDMPIFYGYTSYYKDFNMINNKKINVQIAVCGDEIIVGFPAILTGF